MRYSAALLLFASLGACLPLSTYYKEGASVARLERDETACDVRALKDAPVANQTRVEPPRYVPRRTRCNASGQCTSYGGYFQNGATYTVDTNKRLRLRVKHLCMQDQGYRSVEIPACSPAIAKAAPSGATQILPNLTGNSCAIKRQDGSVLIVEKG
ncbi:MAG: hypothetical protein ABJ091_11860 [Lentilitoribacter sp.]